MVDLNKVWYKFYSPRVRPRLHYPDLTMPQYLDKSAKDFPERAAIVFAETQYSFRKLAGLVNQCAGALNALGVKKGDRVAIMSPNCPQYILGFLATLKLGAVVVQVNPMYVERELEYILKDSGAQTIIAYDALYRRIKNVRSRVALQNVLVFTLGKGSVAIDSNALQIEELLPQYPTQFQQVPLDMDEDIAVFQYTGGTTGVSKGAMLTHRNLTANTLQVTEWMETMKYGKDKVLCALPFFHSYGMTGCLNFSIINAATMIIMAQFNIKECMELIKHEKPTIFPGVPTMYIAVNNYPNAQGYGIKSIKSCMSGSAPLPMEVVEQFEKLTEGLLVEGYGLSEASPVTHCNPLLERRKVGSIGIPLPDTDCKIVDLETGLRELPPGEIGELCIKGPQVMKGYWNMPEETANTLKNEWLYTGDIAKMDEEGYCYIVDRKKDIIIAGGYNIYPREIEEVLYEHPKIREAVAVGVPDPYRGETVKAFIVLKEGMQADAKEIIHYCRANLARYKVPQYVEFRNALPQNVMGKVLRRILREEESQKI
ncbi:Long-chain-fatty-acid--CoA ligase [Sporotomaculum syntrophicum]|uniref:Long-chain-fatty-acid--CoA ligase n=1 Tax=Sporotomaculum syntrophicum TaxID=182264 RepID=A0A9D2WQS5_9FIRM|nr:long-chain fatty acid--CoA ligase [Sporotomaculum syntrophicum]KAF1085368.1 Long-chain-fatty-acid--CoA ligase [Sporotomaculum syntrophicum]